MLEHSSQTLIEYAGRDAVLDRWLLHRQWIIAGYCEITRNMPAKPPSRETLEHWCTELLDYLTASHFKVFVALAESLGKEGSRKLYDRIADTTQALVRCQEMLLQAAESPDLQKHLSVTGELLATQLELEDRWVHHLLSDKEATCPPSF